MAAAPQARPWPRLLQPALLRSGSRTTSAPYRRYGRCLGCNASRGRRRSPDPPRAVGTAAASAATPRRLPPCGHPANGPASIAPVEPAAPPRQPGTDPPRLPSRGHPRLDSSPGKAPLRPRPQEGPAVLAVPRRLPARPERRGSDPRRLRATATTSIAQVLGPTAAGNPRHPAPEEPADASARARSCRGRIPPDTTRGAPGMPDPGAPLASIPADGVPAGAGGALRPAPRPGGAAAATWAAAAAMPPHGAASGGRTA